MRPVGFESDFSSVGHLRNEIEQKLSRKAEDYEVNSLRSHVGNLEHTVRELSSKIDGLESRLQTMEENLRNEIYNRM